jgi:hypothetical protein
MLVLRSVESIIVWRGRVGFGCAGRCSRNGNSVLQADIEVVERSVG